MCYPNISGGGKGYVGPDKKAPEAGKVPDTPATTDTTPSDPQLCDQSKIQTEDGIAVAIGKIGKLNPELFTNIWNDLEVDHAKSVIKDIIKTPGKDKGKIADLIRDFDETTSKMDKSQLIEVAKHINELMKNTNGNDDVLGSLMNSVLDKMSPAKGRPPGGPIWDEKIPLKPFPWDEKLPIDLYQHEIDGPPGLDDKFQHKKIMIADGHAYEVTNPWEDKGPNIDTIQKDFIKDELKKLDKNDGTPKFDKLDDKFQHKKTLIVDNKVPDKDIF
jgi:hypothetical protein